MTTDPDRSMYTGYDTSDELKRDSGPQFGQFRTFCSEPSRVANGPNIDWADDCVLQSGETRQTKTTDKFGW